MHHPRHVGILLVLLLSLNVQAQAATAPVISYTDTPSGPTTGGEGGNGAYVSIFGRNFGAAAGLGTTTRVYFGAAEVANYRSLGLGVVGGKLGIQQLTVQVGALGGAAVGTLLPVKVVVNGVASNTTCTFTPTSGRILFVALNGNDATAVPNDITRPWRHLQVSSNGTGVYFAMRAGDQVVIRGGAWSDTTGHDATWMRASQGADARNGTAAAWIHITAHPGPINGNAHEDVHYTTPAGTSGGIAGPWSAIAGTSGEYWCVSNLHLEVSGGANRDAAPINFQYTAGPWRVVNNELGPWVAGSSATLNAGGLSGAGDAMQVLGNHIHHIAGTTDLQNHGIYAGANVQNWEIAYNWIHDISGGSLVQFNDAEGGAGSMALPHGGIWPGFVGLRIHHNWLENAAKYGLNFSDQQATHLGRYDGRCWNNVIIGTTLPPIRIISTQPDQNLEFAFNTLHDCMVATSGTGNAFVRTEAYANTTVSGSAVRNRFYDNILSFGPHTVAGTQWLRDAGAGGAYAATTTTYDFKRNLYFANGQAPTAPGTLGDASAVIANPLFTNATSYDLSLQSGSPAVNAGSQTLPAGFVVVDDFSGSSRSVSDIGAYEYHAVGGDVTPPTITTAAIGPGTVRGTGATLTVGASDNGGTAGLTYTWAVASWSGSGVNGATFTPNGTTGAATSVVTFAHAGTYTFTVTVRDPADNGTTSTTAPVVVAQVTNAVVVVESSPTVASAGSVALHATMRDQFGDAIAGAVVAWSVDAGGIGGAISAAGIFTAPATVTSGAAVVRAVSGGHAGTTTVQVLAASGGSTSSGSSASGGGGCGAGGGLAVFSVLIGLVLSRHRRFDG